MSTRINSKMECLRNFNASPRFTRDQVKFISGINCISWLKLRTAIKEDHIYINIQRNPQFHKNEYGLYKIQLYEGTCGPK